MVSSKTYNETLPEFVLNTTGGGGKVSSIFQYWSATFSVSSQDYILGVGHEKGTNF